MSPRLSLVIPAYREAASLCSNLMTIRKAIESLGEIEFVVVDDGSPDETWQQLQTLSQEWPWLRAVRLSRNFGKESALSAGVTEAKGDAVIVMDADLQHPPHLIPEMVRLWSEEGYDVVNTVKLKRQREGVIKRWLTRRYFNLFSSLAGMDLGNATDFKLLDRRVVECLKALPENSRFFRGLVAWVGFKQTTLTFDVPERIGGRSSWSIKKLFSLAIDSILAFSTAPMHLMTFLGVAFGILSLVLTIQTLRLWLMGQAVPGFSTVILLLIFTGSILMLGLGIIGAYIAKIYDEVKARPKFIIRERLGAAPSSSHQNDRDRKDRSAAAEEKAP